MARQAIGSAPLDVAIQPQHGRKKKLLASDMDATLIENEIVDEIAAVAGLREQIAPITARSVAGEIDFLTSLQERVALLQGLSAARYFEAKKAIRFVPGGKNLIATMRANGAHTLIVSGGFRAFTSYVRDALGMNEDAANDVEITGGILTGKLVPPVIGREQKAEILRHTAMRLGLAISETLAVGDGANDAAMLAASGLGVAFRAKPALKKVAAAAIDHGDLTALLYLQGYRAEEIRR
jgi:phosphoserine phosphatase